MKIMPALLLMSLIMIGPTQALTVSAKVGPLLKEAQSLIAAGDYKAATAKLDEADAVKVSADDESVIHQFRNVIAARTSQPAQP